MTEFEKGYEQGYKDGTALFDWRVIDLYKSWAHISLALSTGNLNILKSPVTTPKHPTLESLLKNYEPISLNTCTGYKVNHLYLRDGYGHIIDVGRVE